MAKLKWDESAKKFYEAGVNKGVLYLQDANGEYPSGVAWNGLINVTESPSGAEPTPQYADNMKYINMLSVEEYGATIEAYTYPDEFAACDGSVEIADGVTIGQQTRKPFGLVYVTQIGNDIDGIDHGYKIHIVYGAMAAPSEKGYSTINDSPEAITFAWDITTTPVPVTGKKPTASVVIDSRTADPTKLAALELKLFGDVATPAELPLPDEIATMMAAG